jgi:hypothetical protein
MRADMAKVIVERPRYGSRCKHPPKGERKRRQKLGLDGLPRREGVRRRWGGLQKGLNEHLGPLRRYLDANVGRPWDKVFSEVCANISRDSAVQDHVRDHVEDYVERHVILIDGVPCLGRVTWGLLGWKYGQPLSAMGRRPRWYVCPRSGLLKRVPRPRPAPAKKATPRPVRIDESHVCRVFNGQWCLVDVKKLPALLEAAKRRDVLLDRPVSAISPAEAVREYGARVYAVAWRPLKKAELRRYPIPMEQWI